MDLKAEVCGIRKDVSQLIDTVGNLSHQVNQLGSDVADIRKEVLYYTTRPGAAISTALGLIRKTPGWF